MNTHIKNVILLCEKSEVFNYMNDLIRIYDILSTLLDKFIDKYKDIDLADEKYKQEIDNFKYVHIDSHDEKKLFMVYSLYQYNDVKIMCIVDSYNIKLKYKDYKLVSPLRLDVGGGYSAKKNTILIKYLKSRKYTTILHEFSHYLDNVKYNTTNIDKYYQFNLTNIDKPNSKDITSYIKYAINYLLYYFFNYTELRAHILSQDSYENFVGLINDFKSIIINDNEIIENLRKTLLNIYNNKNFTNYSNELVYLFFVKKLNEKIDKFKKKTKENVVYAYNKIIKSKQPYKFSKIVKILNLYLSTKPILIDFDNIIIDDYKEFLNFWEMKYGNSTFCSTYVSKQRRKLVYDILYKKCPNEDVINYILDNIDFMSSKLFNDLVEKYFK